MSLICWGGSRSGCSRTGIGAPFCAARVVAVGLLLAAAACGGAPNPPVQAATGRAAVAPPAGAMTTPAGRYCLSKGGRVLGENGPQGLRSMCHLPDHRVAEVGALYRAEVVDPL